MAEYIDKSKLYENIAHLEEVARRKFLDTMSGDVGKELYRAQLSERTGIKHMIIDMPAADVVPVVHGEWISAGAITSKCSCCRHTELNTRAKEYNYCPNCGAKMDG